MHLHACRWSARHYHRIRLPYGQPTCCEQEATQHTCVLRHSKSSGPATERMGRSEIVRWRLQQLQLDALDRSFRRFGRARLLPRAAAFNPQGLDPRDLSRSHWAERLVEPRREKPRTERNLVLTGCESLLRKHGRPGGMLPCNSPPQEPPRGENETVFKRLYASMLLCAWRLPSFRPQPCASRGSANQHTAGICLYKYMIYGIRICCEL